MVWCRISCWHHRMLIFKWWWKQKVSSIIMLGSKSQYIQRKVNKNKFEMISTVAKIEKKYFLIYFRTRNEPTETWSRRIEHNREAWKISDPYKIPEIPNPQDPLLAWVLLLEAQLSGSLSRYQSDQNWFRDRFHRRCVLLQWLDPDTLANVSKFFAFKKN